MMVVLKVGDIAEWQVNWAAGRVASTSRPRGHGRERLSKNRKGGNFEARRD